MKEAEPSCGSECEGYNRKFHPGILSYLDTQEAGAWPPVIGTYSDVFRRPVPRGTRTKAKDARPISVAQSYKPERAGKDLKEDESEARSCMCNEEMDIHILFGEA